MQTNAVGTDAQVAAFDRAPLRLLLLRAHDPRALPIRQYIRDQFARSYGAHIRDFLPLQLAMARGHAIKAAAGMRRAGIRRLFVEQYLDRPCEAELGAHFSMAPPAREAVAEVGNLAATESGAARELFFHIAVAAVREDLHWLMCNATLRVQALLRHMALPFSPLCDSDPERVEDRAAWGSYYDKPSRVMAAPVAGIIEAMRENDPLRLAAARRLSGSATATSVPRIEPDAQAGDRPTAVVAEPVPCPTLEITHDPN